MSNNKKLIHTILILVLCLSLLSIVVVKKIDSYNKQEEVTFKVVYETCDLPQQLKTLLFTTKYLEFISSAGYEYDALNSTMSNRVTDLSHPNVPYFRLTTYQDGSYLVYITNNEIEVSFFLDQDLQASDISAEGVQGENVVLTKQEENRFLSEANAQLKIIVNNVYNTMYK